MFEKGKKAIQKEKEQNTVNVNSNDIEIDLDDLEAVNGGIRSIREVDEKKKLEMPKIKMG